MKIVYLHQYFNTPEMSGGTRSYEMARRLVARGHEVHLITSRREGAAPDGGWEVTNEAGITVHWLYVPYSNATPYAERIVAFFRFAAASARRAASVGGDVIFASSTPLTIALPGAYAAWRGKIPMVFEVRDLWPELPIAAGAIKSRTAIYLARCLERFAYRNSAAIVALSPGMKDGVIRAGYPAEKVEVIPNSADLELFRVPPSEGEAFRKLHNWLGDRPLVVYVGTMGRVNGVDYLARIAAAAKPLNPEVRFLVVGDGVESEHVASVARDLGVLGDNFHMLPPLHKREIPAVLSAANLATSLVVPLPEMRWNSANKYFDALASGTPISINHPGWLADLIREHGVGLIVDEDDAASAAQGIVTALGDQKWLEKASLAAGKLAEEEFSRDRLAEALERVLRGAVAGDGPEGSGR